MNRTRRSGIALILVISLIGLVGVTLAHLAQSCRAMLDGTDREYLRVVERNLIASGLAWAQRQDAGEQADTLILDANEIGGAKARLGVRIEHRGAGPALAHLQVSLARGAEVVERARVFQIPSAAGVSKIDRTPLQPTGSARYDANSVAPGGGSQSRAPEPGD